MAWFEPRSLLRKCRTDNVTGDSRDKHHLEDVLAQETEKSSLGTKIEPLRLYREMFLYLEKNHLTSLGKVISQREKCSHHHEGSDKSFLWMRRVRIFLTP